MEHPEEQENNLPNETSEGEPEKKQETREEVLSRHRKEISRLQGKELALKKAAAKGSKAEQKAKKKQVEDEISKLSAKLKEKHADELASLGYSKGDGKEKDDLGTLVKAIAGVSVKSQAEMSKPSKSTKRRDKRAQQEAAREQRIQEEQDNMVSDRMIENEKLEKKLEPLGLTVNEIKPDGHCLYRAVENQLVISSGDSSPYSYLELRKMVACYMREHASDFLPFEPLYMLEPSFYALAKDPHAVAKHVFYDKQLFEESDSYKTQQFYEFILVDSDSVVITHNRDLSGRISHSKCQILKIISEGDWRQHPLLHKKFSQNFVPATYNYVDYKKAWTRAFLIPSQNCSHSWFFFFCKKFKQPTIPLWFQHQWWNYYGVQDGILPPPVHEGWQVFKSEFKPPSPVPQQVLLLWFFIKLNLTWISCWDFSVSVLTTVNQSVQPPLWLCRKFKIKWWPAFDHSHATKLGVLKFFNKSPPSPTTSPVHSQAPSQSRLLKESLRKQLQGKPTRAQLFETLSRIASSDGSDEDDDATESGPSGSDNEDDCFNIFPSFQQ